MKTLIIPDIHHYTETAENIIKRENADKIICMGDYFDQFYDFTEDAKKTALWLKTKIHDPKYTMLMGNHELNYRWPNIKGKCSGYTEAKAKAINEVLSKEDWDKLKYHVWVEDYLVTHAGLSDFWREGRSVSEIRPWLAREENNVKEGQDRGLLHWFNLVGKARGGSTNVGGLLWCDFSQEFVPVEGLNQIIGHTPATYPRTHSIPNSVNVCIDTHLRHYVVHQDSGFSVECVSRYATPVRFGFTAAERLPNI